MIDMVLIDLSSAGMRSVLLQNQVWGQTDTYEERQVPVRPAPPRPPKPGQDD